jgi:glutaryl-CoA dehydrogenase
MNKLNLLKRNFNINSTEKMILETVNKFCRNDLLPNINKNPDNKLIYKKFGDLGILGPTIKNDYCLGSTYKMYGLIAKEIEYVDSGLRSMFSVQSSLVMNPINKYGSNEIKNKYLESLALGEKIGCFGLTEPDSGSDAGSMKTNAKLVNGNYVLNGSKTWITNSPIADVFLVWAKYENKVHGFVLDRDMKGIETPEIKNKMSLLSSKTGMIFLDNVEVPKENKLDIEGMKGPLSCLNDARLGISFGVLGAAEFCIENALDYSLNRKLFGSPLAQKQIFQKNFADMVTEYNLGLSACIDVAESVDNNESIPEMISLIKRNNCNKSLNIARQTRDMLGGNGISADYNIFRHLVNLETVKTYEGTHDIHSLILGNYITGLKAF